MVPKFTVIVGNSYGAGNYATVRKGTLIRDDRGPAQRKDRRNGGGTEAAKTLLQIQVAGLKAKGEEITPEKKENELLKNYWSL